MHNVLVDILLILSFVLFVDIFEWKNIKYDVIIYSYVFINLMLDKNKSYEIFKYQ